MNRMHTLALAAAALAAALPAAAQTYPTRPVRIVVPFAAGGPADIYARFVGQRLGEVFGQQFVIENRPGAGSIIGTDIVAKSPPDGYTLLMMSNTHTVNESLIPKKPFALMKDFVAVAPVNSSDLLLVTHPSVPVKTVKELVALAKSRPGDINYASSGNGTPYHMAGELFRSMAGINIIHVPYKGSSEARTAVMSGEVHLMIDAITTMAPIVKGGRVRALGTTGQKRSAIMPDVPTVSEAGVKGYEATIWLGIMAPANTPRAVVDRLNAEIVKVTGSPAVREAWGGQGAVPMSMTPAEFEKFLQQDIAKWADVVKKAGVKPN
jgi:tripartite-type tricarboxylate transporter receptor subunit TctC